MTQRFATIGAIFFSFIISNIWVITVSLKFSGTWVINTFILFAVLLLLFWDYHKLKYLFYEDNFSEEAKFVNYPTYNRIWIITVLILFVLSIVGLLLMKKPQIFSVLFSRIWMASILFTITVAIYFNWKKYKRTEII